MKDVPTLTDADAGNFATLNAVQKAYGSVTYSNGNLQGVADANWNAMLSTINVTSGKWYWECTTTTTNTFFGVQSQPQSYNTANPQNFSGTIVYYASNGAKRIDGTETSYGASYTSGDTIGVALDIDGGTITFYKNNSSQGSISLSSSSNMVGKTIAPVFMGLSNTIVANFGQRPFAYTPPSGFKALNTYNLPTPTIADGSKYFDIRLRTGTGSQVTVTGLGFRPDLLWTKTRSNVVNHNVAGTGLTYDYSFLQTNTTNTENTGASHYYMTPTSDGYIVGTGDNINQNTYTFVDWLWKANGSGVSNTDGSITSTVSANTSSGFSIVGYTATNTTGTVGHGLGVAPNMIIVKDRQDASNWYVYHTSIGATNRIWLNTTAASTSDSTAWNNTSPTATVFSVGTSTNYLTHNHIAYCFAPIEGYSAFGSYTGNGSTDGPFVYTGFRPAFILFKCNLAGAHWVIFDVARNTYNLTDRYLQPNTANAEATTYPKIDILSNGFKCRNANDDINYSGYDTIYAAFAENPFKYSLAR
jgi:hypothetical protein